MGITREQSVALGKALKFINRDVNEFVFADNGFTDTREAPAVTKTVKVCSRKASLSIKTSTVIQVNVEYPPSIEISEAFIVTDLAEEQVCY